MDHDQSALPRIGKLITPESVVYDVGAFIGDHTAFYASRAKRVVAFEPTEDAYTCLDKNTVMYENVTLLQYSVGDGAAVQRKLSHDQNRGARYVRESVKPSDDAVFTARLDEICGMTSDLPIPDLIKLDIEGWEVRALRGATKTILEHHPTLVLEVNRGALERAGTSPAELWETCWMLGYRDMTDLFIGQPWSTPDERPQFDVVCCR